jgi:hypothetical protein
MPLNQSRRNEGATEQHLGPYSVPLRGPLPVKVNVGRTNMRITLVIIAMALLLGGCSTPGVNSGGPAPFRIEFGERVSWTEGHEGFDPTLPGYHVTGDIASIVLHPTGHNPPETLILAITTSPGMRPMLEGFKVFTSDTEIDTALFDGLDYESVGNMGARLTHRVKKGTHFKFDIVDKEVLVTFLPDAMPLLRGKCKVSWIDWYRK